MNLKRIAHIFKVFSFCCSHMINTRYFCKSPFSNSEVFPVFFGNEQANSRLRRRLNAPTEPFNQRKITPLSNQILKAQSVPTMRNLWSIRLVFFKWCQIQIKLLTNRTFCEEFDSYRKQFAWTGTRGIIFLTISVGRFTSDSFCSCEDIQPQFMMKLTWNNFFKSSNQAGGMTEWRLIILHFKRLSCINIILCTRSDSRLEWRIFMLLVFCMKRRNN